MVYARGDDVSIAQLLYDVLQGIVGADPVLPLIDGIAESRAVFSGTVAGFWRKLGGVGSYDGLPEMISEVYRSLEMREKQPVSLDEIDAVARLIDQFTKPALML